MRAERCLRVLREQAALWSVLGSHIAHFTLFSPHRELAAHAYRVQIWLQLADAGSLCNPRVHEKLLQSWSTTPDPSANTSMRPTLSQLASRARARGFCVPYLPQTYQHHAPRYGVPVTL